MNKQLLLVIMLETKKTISLFSCCCFYRKSISVTFSSTLVFARKTLWNISGSRSIIVSLYSISVLAILPRVCREPITRSMDVSFLSRSNYAVIAVMIPLDTIFRISLLPARAKFVRMQMMFCLLLRLENRSKSRSEWKIEFSRISKILHSTWACVVLPDSQVVRYCSSYRIPHHYFSWSSTHFIFSQIWTIYAFSWITWITWCRSSLESFGGVSSICSLQNSLTSSYLESFSRTICRFFAASFDLLSFLFSSMALHLFYLRILIIPCSSNLSNKSFFLLSTP